MDTQTKREREKQLLRSGLLLSDPEVLQAMEHESLQEPHFLPVRVGKDGSISGSIASAARLGKLGRYVDKLVRYARQRSDRCPFMETKTFCSNCKVHCYRPEMRESIRAVMVFSGPRMIFHHPLVTVRHMIENKKETRRLEKTR